MYIDIGKMTERIKIEKRTIIYSGGKKLEQWDEYYSCWAYCNNLFGKELYNAMQVKQENLINITVRYCKVLDNLNTKDYRIVWNNKTFNINLVDYHGFNKEKVTFKAMEVI